MRWGNWHLKNYLALLTSNQCVTCCFMYNECGHYPGAVLWSLIPIKQWLSLCVGSGGNFAPRGYSAMSGDIFIVTICWGGGWACYWHLEEARDAAKPPAMHETDSTPSFASSLHTHTPAPPPASELCSPRWQSCWGWETLLWSKAPGLKQQGGPGVPISADTDTSECRAC